VLQEKDSEAGEHIVRARGPWFGNRSISAEVDLPVGTYEILPKIEATRDADAPDVHEVVTKVAEANPQKLRQIGLNYDIANAKGLTELTDEEKKDKERKKKEAAEKKKKKLEQEEKEKADFEAWKKEEKAEYETWKKEKISRNTRESTSKAEAKTSASKDETAPIPEIIVEAASPSTVAESKPEAIDQETGADKVTEAGAPKIKDDQDTSEDDGPQNTPPEAHIPTAASSVADGPAPSQAGRGADAGSVYGDLQATPAPPQANPTTFDNSPKPWNAVCVLGLRVYSQDAKISIKLVKPKDEEEAALLDVDGNTAAGATM